MSKNSANNSKQVKLIKDSFFEEKIKDLKFILKDLYLISETDSLFEIELHVLDLKKLENKSLEKLSINEFFDSKIGYNDWFDDFMKLQTLKYQQFMNFVLVEINDVEIYKIGEIEKDLIISGKIENQPISIKASIVET